MPSLFAYLTSTISSYSSQQFARLTLPSLSANTTTKTKKPTAKRTKTKTPPIASSSLLSSTSLTSSTTRSIVAASAASSSASTSASKSSTKNSSGYKTAPASLSFSSSISTPVATSAPACSLFSSSSCISGFIAYSAIVLLCCCSGIKASWEEWWTYDGISGPGFWGLINPQWNMCNKGHRQSPIDVLPDKLLFDPFLRPLHIDKHKVSGTLHNTGQSLVFRVDKDTKQHVNITGGPLAYRYQFEEIYIHYGTENTRGSEHFIQGYSFPGEIQIYGFNNDLYHNMSEAQHKSQGVVGLSLMVQIGETPNPELRIITSTFNKVLYRGFTTPIRHLSVRSLLPNTDHYITYEGSTTHPGCWESTVWIIINKPIYITKQELYQLRRLMQGSESSPKAPLGNNARPVQNLHHRTVRTNIDFKKNKNQNSCPSMYKDMYYRANRWSADTGLLIR